MDLQREQVLERLRGQAQGMQSSEDIGQVVENVFSELKALHSGVLTAGVAAGARSLADTGGRKCCGAAFGRWALGFRTRFR